MSTANTVKLFIASLPFIFHFVGRSQVTTIDNDRFTIAIKHARKLSKVQASTRAILGSDHLKTVFVKLRMTSNNTKETFDINKFSLVETNNKLRCRPIDISYQEFTTFISFYRLAMEPLNFKSSDIRYEPEIHDSFNDFDFEEYTSLEIPLNYGGFRNPKNHVAYFKPRKFKSKKLNFFFPFPKDCTAATLYFGNEKVADLTFK